METSKKVTRSKPSIIRVGSGMGAVFRSFWQQEVLTLFLQLNQSYIPESVFNDIFILFMTVSP